MIIIDKFHQVTTPFILSVCLADFLFAIVLLPTQATRWQFDTFETIHSKKFAEPPFQSKKLRKKCWSFLGHFGSFWANFGSFLGHFVAFLDKFAESSISFCGSNAMEPQCIGAAELAFRMYVWDPQPRFFRFMSRDWKVGVGPENGITCQVYPIILFTVQVPRSHAPPVSLTSSSFSSKWMPMAPRCWAWCASPSTKLSSFSLVTWKPFRGDF